MKISQGSRIDLHSRNKGNSIITNYHLKVAEAVDHTHAPSQGFDCAYFYPEVEEHGLFVRHPMHLQEHSPQEIESHGETQRPTQTIRLICQLQHQVIKRHDEQERNRIKPGH